VGISIALRFNHGSPPYRVMSFVNRMLVSCLCTFASHRAGASAAIRALGGGTPPSTQGMSGTGPFGRGTCTGLDERSHGRIAQRIAPVDQGLLFGFIERIQPRPDVLQSVGLGRVARDLVGGGVLVVAGVDTPICGLLTAQLGELDEVARAQAARLVGRD